LGGPGHPGRKADLVAFGRALLADPHLPNKAFAGKNDEIRKCTTCMDCRRRVGDFGWKIKCSVNPDLGNEGAMTLAKAERPRKVMVIGGGLAGMEAARVARLRGHRVTLYERGKKLGGQLSLAVVPPHKEELKNILEYLTHQMDSLKIPVKKGLEVDMPLIRKSRPDVVIVATGSKPTCLSLAGEVKVLCNYEILTGKLPRENNFLVVGGGSVGCEVAEYLADKGKKVCVVEILDQVAGDAQSVVRRLLAQRLKEKGVAIYTRSQVQRADGDEVTVVDHDGKSRELPADVVVVTIGATPDPLPLPGFEKLKPVPAVYFVGDCRQAGKIMQAVHDGNRIGRLV
jgi:2-enoate reductase